MKNKGVAIEIHRVDDWEALYVDGEIYTQQHSGTLESYVGDEVRGDEPLVIASVKWIDHDGDAVGKHVEDSGHFPDRLSDLAQIEIDAMEADVRKAEEALRAALVAKETALQEKRAALAAMKAKT